MSDLPNLPIFLGGLSGVGKSSTGCFLGSNGFLHLEADVHGGDGITILKLRSDWDRFFLNLNPIPLAEELERRRISRGAKRVILTIPSTPLTPSHLLSADGYFKISFLTGPSEACIQSFIARGNYPPEKHLSARAFWHQNNDGLVEALRTLPYERLQIQAFAADGQRLQVEEVARKLNEAE